MTGCSGGSADTPAPESAAPATQPAEETTTLSGTVNTDGSTSMADVMAVLQETFREAQPDITVNYTGSGSGAGAGPRPRPQRRRPRHVER